MQVPEIVVPFRVTVRGGSLRPDLLMTAHNLARQLREQEVPVKIRVGDGLFGAFAKHAGQCYCHAEMGEQRNAVHELQVLEPRPDPDSPMRLWAVVQDRFDLVRAMCDTDAFLLFPLDERQTAEVAYMLAEAGRRACSVPVALVGWSRKQRTLLARFLPKNSAVVLKLFSAQAEGLLDFLRDSKSFLARTCQEAAA